MRLILILMLLYVEAALALQASMWTEEQSKTICALALRRLYGDTLSVVGFMGKQPHENNTVLIGLVANDNRIKHKGQQVTVGCIYKQDGSLVTMFFNSQIPNWIAPNRRQAQSATTEQARQKPVKTEPITLKVSLGYMEYEIWDVAWLERIPRSYGDLFPNAMYLVVDLSVTNTDKSSSTVPPFRLIDSRGAEYDTTSDSYYLERDFSVLEKLNPDVTKRGTILFDVPRRADYKLRLSGGILSGKSTLVEIQPRELP